MHQKNQNKNQKQHEPVLVSEVMSLLAPIADESYLDLTAGYGGHAAAVLKATGRADLAVLVDRDAMAIRALKQRFTGARKPEIMHADFYEACQALLKRPWRFDLILADLGLSSPHLNEANRGFSLQKSGPLDMRMDQSQTLTADEIINHWPEGELAAILENYGEEPKARQIAAEIVRRRPLANTEELAALATKFWPRHRRIHPATRTFQAIRIAVNDELGLLEKTLPLAQKLLAPGGRLAIISFHSLEDRIVKQYFAEKSRRGYDAELELLTKHPVRASPHQIVHNPRARSAKLRVVANKQQKERSH